MLGKGGKRRVTDVKEVDGEGGAPLTETVTPWCRVEKPPLLENGYYNKKKCIK